MSIVTDVDANICKGSFEYGVSESSRFEIKLFPKTRFTMRYMMFPIFTKIFTVSIYYRCSVIVNACIFNLINGNDQSHAMFFSYFLHKPYGWSVRNFFD